jgi:hypothetical protein
MWLKFKIQNSKFKISYSARLVARVTNFSAVSARARAETAVVIKPQVVIAVVTAVRT